MWEYERHDWSKLRSSESAANVPASIERLRLAATDGEADAAYWRIDNEVIVQGALYESALPAAICLVSALATCTAFARPKILELLFQIGNGASHPSEVALGNSGLPATCRREICRGVALVFDAIESATPEWLDVCVDLLILCGDEDTTLLPRIDWYFRRILSQDVFVGLRETMVKWQAERRA